MKCRLIISIPIEVETEEDAIRIGKEKAHTIVDEVGDRLVTEADGVIIPDDSQFTLTRDGDRSALNLLLPKLDGRVGEHYQGRKATKKEVM
jgi:hypothetical protein